MTNTSSLAASLMPKFLNALDELEKDGFDTELRITLKAEGATRPERIHHGHYLTWSREVSHQAVWLDGEWKWTEINTKDTWG